MRAGLKIWGKVGPGLRGDRILDEEVGPAFVQDRARRRGKR